MIVCFKQAVYEAYGIVYQQSSWGDTLSTRNAEHRLDSAWTEQSVNSCQWVKRPSDRPAALYVISSDQEHGAGPRKPNLYFGLDNQTASGADKPWTPVVNGSRRN